MKKILALIFLMTLAGAAIAQSSRHPKTVQMNPPGGGVGDATNASSIPNAVSQQAGAAQQSSTTNPQAGNSAHANNGGGGRKVCRTIKSVDYYCL